MNRPSAKGRRRRRQNKVSPGVAETEWEGGGERCGGGQAGRCFDRPLWTENPDPSRSEAAAAAAAA